MRPTGYVRLAIGSSQQPKTSLVICASSVSRLLDGFTTARPAGRFFARSRYCPISATELFSMCRMMPGTIEPVRS